MRYSSKGFTFLELVVVLVILGVMSSIVFVRVGRSVTSKRPRLFVQEMVGLCRKARRLAIADGMISSFYISSDERKCWVNSRQPLEIPAEIKVEGEGVKELENGIFGIRFFPDGSSSGGSLFISRSDNRLYAFRVDMLTGLIMPIKESETRP